MTAGDPHTQGEKVVTIRVPWAALDDNFYHARGVAYGIHQTLELKVGGVFAD